MQETNRRSFGARCGGDPLWIILDNQHPCFQPSELLLLRQVIFIHIKADSTFRMFDFI
ncbi:hypothetical protein HMPREF0083_03666 [Aneurinibacillus aneurinilyticus ATCC 12856]|uniref:Uncharacterized protein n=1 Tax=Aneurinibacillus aneurinilyticus ATCC 12856 TaxID=649747 RepID=U1YBT4_ANEAE|nr:hypothetical protein HMPREF0083_03666 [Aneurinibacillus aneurinilyticus ATCC 12856]